MNRWSPPGGVLLIAVGLAGCTGPARIPSAGDLPVTDLLDVARELGMAVERSPVSQGLTLTDSANRVVVVPGSTAAVVNGRIVDLGRPAMYHQGRLVVPVEGLKRITANLKGRPSGAGARR